MPKYYPTAKYQSDIGSLGMSMDPRTANQLGEVNTKINPGLRHVELLGLNTQIMDSIPDQHLEEINRLSRLTGVTTSLHGPLVEASGIGEKGGWEEGNRIGAEKQLESALLRAHKLDPKGNVSVTVHSTAQLPEMITKIKEKNEKTGKMEERTTGMLIINPEVGKIAPIEYEKRFFPKDGKFEPEKTRVFNETEELEKINKDQWTQQISDINRHATYGEEILDRAKQHLGISEKSSPEEINKLLANISKKNFNPDSIPDSEDRQIFKNAQKEAIHGQIYLKDAYRNLKNVFDRAYLNSSDEDKQKLKAYAQEITPLITKDIEDDPRILGDVVEKGVKVLNEIKTPSLWKPLNEFVIEQSAKTYGNIATKAFKEFGSSAPVLNIENPPAGSGLSRADDLKNLIEASRKVIVENLKKDGVSGSEAKQAAEKLIGATWDVGHINMIRKKGYSEEDVIAESKIIAPFVKHVHLSDNFGLDHTELPMGMGNVPLKEIMKKLGDKGFEGKKIIEAGNWWQHFAEKGGGNPFKPSIEAFNSPIYAMKESAYWSTPPTFGAYYTGHGPINPPVHHKLYGSGFENLPTELGGEIPGERGRFSGTPNA